MTSSNAAPGWYPDTDPSAERYWDGQAWTHQTRPLMLTPPAPAYQPQGGHAAPAGPKKKSRKKWVWGGAVVAVLAVIGIAAGTGGSGKKDAADAKPSPAATVSNALATKSKAAPVTTGEKTTTPAPTTKAAPPKPVTLLNISGSGIKKSAYFTTGDEWTISYTYDCASFGYQGNFQVYAYPDGDDGFPDVAANELGMKGSDSTSEHDAGKYYLEINSECDWTVKVTG